MTCNVNNKFIDRTATRASSALGCHLHICKQKCFQLTPKIIIVCQDHADIQVRR